MLQRPQHLPGLSLHPLQVSLVLKDFYPILCLQFLFKPFTHEVYPTAGFTHPQPLSHAHSGARARSALGTRRRCQPEPPYPGQPGLRAEEEPLSPPPPSPAGGKGWPCPGTRSPTVGASPGSDHTEPAAPGPAPAPAAARAPPPPASCPCPRPGAFPGCSPGKQRWPPRTEAGSPEITWGTTSSWCPVRAGPGAPAGEAPGRGSAGGAGRGRKEEGPEGDLGRGVLRRRRKGLRGI